MMQGAQPDGIGRGGGRFKREGTYKYVYVWLIHIVVRQKSTQHCKAIILQLKYTHAKTEQLISKVDLKLPVQ